MSALLVPVLVLLSVMGLADCGSAGTSRAISSLAASTLHPPVCRPNDVAASLGSEFDSATGEQDDLFVLTNRSSESCRLDGYPRISLGDHSKRLAFVYEQGGWPYVTLRKPQRVVMGSGGHAYFLVAKYRCEGGTLSKASAIRISLPPKRRSTGGSRFPRGAGLCRLDADARRRAKADVPLEAPAGSRPGAVASRWPRRS
jgi:hypothetical protein